MQRLLGVNGDHLGEHYPQYMLITRAQSLLNLGKFVCNNLLHYIPGKVYFIDLKIINFIHLTFL